MARSFLILILLILPFMLCLENIVSEPDDGKFYKRNKVFILNDRNHPSFVNLYKYVFVYYKEEDGTEEDLEIRAKLETLADELEKISPKAFVAELDLTKETFTEENEMGVREIVGINSLPYYKFYVSMSRAFDYKKDLKVEEIVDYVKSKITLSSTEIFQIDDFQKKYEFDRPLITFIGESNTANYVAYQETAKLLMYDKNLTFTHLDILNLSPDLAEAIGVPSTLQDYVIKVFNPNGNSAEYSEGEVDHLKLKDFIANSAFSDLNTEEIHTIGDDAFGKILIYHKAIFLFFTGTDEAASQKDEKVINQFLSQIDTLETNLYPFKTDFNLDPSKKSHVFEILDVSPTSESQLWIMDFTDLEKDVQRYKFTGNEISLQLLQAFYSGWKDDKLTPFHPPESEQGGSFENGVLRLDQDIFYEIIRDPGYETFVFYYIDDCDICDMFLPVFEKVAMELKGKSTFKLAKINMSKNTLEGQEGVGEGAIFPKVVFYPNDKLQAGVEFNAGVQVSDILAFLHKHHTLEVGQSDVIKEDL